MIICEALRKARNISGKSQEFMSLELGVARKTIQNWEKGTSEPTLGQAIRWFEAININPLPYLFQVVHTDIDGIKSTDDVLALKKALNLLLEELPEEGVRQLLYLFYGDHGSSPRAIMNMITAHLQTPMRDRVTQGTVIVKNYEMAFKEGNIASPDHIKPNIELLHEAIAKGEEAVYRKADAYIIEKIN